MSCTRHVLSCTHVLVMYSVVKKSQRRFPWITGFSQALGSRLCFAQTNYQALRQILLYATTLHPLCGSRVLVIMVIMWIDNGRAWIGFTASTGDSKWQVHDILSWTFDSSRLDKTYVPPVVVNAHGAHACSKVNEGGDCVHI